VSKHLATHYSVQRFSAVIDAYGVRELYSHCGDYLSPGKPFVTVGVAHKTYGYLSMLHAVFRMAVNSLTSLLPGKERRKYVQVNAAVNTEALEKLRSLAEEGKLRVPIDSCWGMMEALKVRCSS
jgi:Zinc-binding dehydrogenase